MRLPRGCPIFLDTRWAGSLSLNQVHCILVQLSFSVILCVCREEGIRVLEVPGRIPAIVSGGKSRRNHAHTKLVVFSPLFPERHLQRLVFFAFSKTQEPILIFLQNGYTKGAQWKWGRRFPPSWLISPFPAPFSFGLIIMVLGLLHKLCKLIFADERTDELVWRGSENCCRRRLVLLESKVSDHW